MTSIQKTEAMRAVAGTRDCKPGLGKFLLTQTNMTYMEQKKEEKRFCEVLLVYTSIHFEFFNLQYLLLAAEGVHVHECW